MHATFHVRRRAPSLPAALVVMMIMAGAAHRASAQIPMVWTWSADHPNASFQTQQPSTHRLFQALNRRDAIDLKDGTLKMATQHLSDTFQVPILIDERGLEEESVTLEEPIQLSLPEMPLAQVLHGMLAPLNLTYTIQGEAIVITSQRRASEILVVYDVTPITLERASPGVKGALTLRAMVRMVEWSIAPDQWFNQGGTSTIWPFVHPDGSRRLLVRATLETHDWIRELFSSLSCPENGASVTALSIRRQIANGEFDEGNTTVRAPRLRQSLR